MPVLEDQRSLPVGMQWVLPLYPQPAHTPAAPWPPPLPQLMLMHIMQLWHYPGANVFTEIPHSGIPAWVPWCYFVYSSAVAQLSRYLKKTE